MWSSQKWFSRLGVPSVESINVRHIDANCRRNSSFFGHACTTCGTNRNKHQMAYTKFESRIGCLPKSWCVVIRLQNLASQVFKLYSRLGGPKYWKLLLVQGIWGPAKNWLLFKSLHETPGFPSLEKVQDLAFQVLTMIALCKDLAFQVLKLFAGNSLVMDLSKNWIMFFMTWSSKTWTQVNIFLKTWLPQVWNLSYFFQDLACQVLKCYVFATPCPQVLTMIALF